MIDQQDIKTTVVFDDSEFSLPENIRTILWKFLYQNAPHLYDSNNETIKEVKTLPTLLTHSRLYMIWCELCQSSSVYHEWALDFTCFEGWAYENGYREYLTLEQIEADIGFYPSNCRWGIGDDSFYAVKAASG